MRSLPAKPPRLGPIIISIPEGLKEVIAEPSLVLAHRPARCAACGHQGAWHLHGRRPRQIQIADAEERFFVVRFRCPRCRLTATVLPADVLAGVRQDLGTVAEIVATYLDGECGYRTLPLAVLGIEPPADLTASTVWGQPEAPSPTPSTCFRWLARFAAGARAWWITAATAVQVHGEYVPPAAPTSLARRARSETKREALRWAWQAVHAVRLLAVQLGAPLPRWPFVMRHAPSPPRGLDRTGWFLSGSASPCCKPPPPP